MAVSTDNAFSGPFLANGVTTVFPFTFTAPSPAEVAVLVRNSFGLDVAAGTFTVTLNPAGAAGGSITFDVPPADELTITPILAPEFTQDLSFADGSAWLAAPVNEGYDRAALRAQALKRDADRAIKAPIGSDGIELSSIAEGQVLALLDGRIGGVDNDPAFAEDAAQKADRALGKALVAEANAEAALSGSLLALSYTEIARDDAQEAALATQGFSNQTVRSLWDTGLKVVAGAAEQIGMVLASDTGNHLQLTATGYNGASVANAGQYVWSTAWTGWIWLGPLESTAAETARLATAALLATAEDFQFDGPAAVALMQSVARGGRASVDRAAIAYTRGVYFDFAVSLFVLAGVNASDPDHFAGFVTARSSAAYALNKAGVYSNFAANALRVTNRGALIEGAATQLCSQPVDFSNAAWGKSAAAAAAVASGAPDGASAAYDLSETVTSGAGQSYVQIATAALPIGVHTNSVHLQRGAERYTGILLTIPVAGSAAWVVDWDAVGGPSIVWAAGGGFTALNFGLINIGNGWYRVWVRVYLAAAGAINMRVQGFGGLNYADRTYATAAGRIFARAAFAQIEAGAAPTSPILVGAATRAADVATLTLPSGNPTDRFAITWEGGAGVYRRADLAVAGTLNLVSDFGAPWAGSYIQRIELLPALDERLLAANPSGGVPWLVAMGGTFALNGKVFGSESEIMEALGSSSNGSIRSIEGYVSIDAPNLLAGVDFTIDQQGFTVVQDATAGISGGYLTMAIGTNPALASALGRKMVVEAGKAYRFSATMKASASGGFLQATLANRADFGGGTYMSAAYAGTQDSTLSVVGASGFGTAMYVGMYHLPGIPSGLVGSLKSPALVETSPGAGFPSGNVSIELVGTSPAVLPTAAQVLAQVDAGGEKDRWRIEWAADGSVHLKAQIVGGADGQSIDLPIGNLAASASFHLVAGMSCSVLRGAIGGAGAQVDVMMPVGAAALRIGRDSANGSQFQGAIAGKIISSGVESLEWMKNRTKASPREDLPIPVLGEGDSYSTQITGYSGILAEPTVRDDNGATRRRFEVVCTGVGSTTFADQYNRLIANASLYKSHVVVWWDGSENGHVNGQYAAEFGQFQAVVAAGYSRILYVRSGQIPIIAGGLPTTARQQSSQDMDNLFEAIRGTYGPAWVFDPLPILRTFVSGQPGAAARVLDESDLAFGYMPRSLFVDGAHISIAARRAVVNGRPGLPGMADAIVALARS